MPELLAIAEFVDKLQAVCHQCGMPATMTQRLVDGEPARLRRRHDRGRRRRAVRGALPCLPPGRDPRADGVPRPPRPAAVPRLTRVEHRVAAAASPILDRIIETTAEHHRIGLLVRIARELNTAIRAFFYDRCTQHAAGIAYRVLFALAPLAIVLVWVTGIFLADRDLGDAVTDAIINTLPIDPASRDQVLQAVESVASPTSAAGFVAIIGLAWTASGIISSIRSGLEQAMRVEERAAIARRKLVDVVLVIGAGGLVVLLVALSSLATLVRRWLQPVLERIGLEAVLGSGITPIITGVAAVGVTLVLYRFVPARTVPFRDALAGAAATGLMTAGIALASSYVFNAVLEMSSIFGSITTVFVFLYSVYLHACALLLGAEIARVRGLPPDQLEHVVPAEVHTVRQWLASWRSRH